MHYSTLERTDVNGKRHYITPKGTLPSVTTILQATSPQDKLQSLERWRERIGYGEAERITQFSADAGTVMHNLLEQHFNPDVEHSYAEFSEDTYSLGVRMYRAMLRGLQGKNIIPVAQEPTLYFQSKSGNGYAGSTDFVCKLDNELIIVDWKNARKAKRKEWIEDYMLQACAYIQAHNQMYNTNIQEARIFLVTHDLQFQEFSLTAEDLAHYTKLWWKRCRNYFANN